MTETTDGTPGIESVDAFARQLYRRARDAGTDFVDLAIAISNLHTALKHLCSEANDRDSPLHQPHPARSGSRDSVYARQFRSLVEDSDFALKQADTILERDGGIKPGSGAVAVRRDSDLAERARKIDLIRGDIVSQTMKIDIFLDTVQLHHPAKTQRVLENADRQQMDMIKTKVDAIASRLFRERKDQSPLDVDEDALWQSFKAELEREGFSREVLRRNKEVLRAYIRELESHQPLGGGIPPSVQGLLEWDAQPPMVVASASYPIHHGDSIPNSDTGPLSNEAKRRGPTSEAPDPLPSVSQPRSSAAPKLPPQLSFEPDTSESSDTEASPSSHTALISTRDLMALDRYSADKVAALSGNPFLLPIQPPFHVISPGTSPNNRYLPPGLQGIPVAPYDGQPVVLPPAYPGAPSPGSSPHPYGTSLTMSSSAASWDLATLPASAPTAGNDMPKYPSSPRQYSHLAPDSKGQTIPLDATWTKIDRKLVSPEVLEKAGVRYEARPSFVAVLGVLTREQIEEYARRSFEVRNARSSTTTKTGNNERSGPRGLRQETYGDTYRRRRGLDSVRDDGSEALFDASDSDSSNGEDGRHRAAGCMRNRGRYTPKEYAPNRGRHLDSEDEEKGTKIYPIIVSPPASVNGDSLSPSSTVAPKPILKNRNPNHVRFDRSGPTEISPAQYSDRARRDRDREREGGKTRRDKSRERSRDRSRLRDGDRDRATKDRDKDRERDRDRDRDLVYRHASKRHPDRDRERGRDKASDREKDRDRDRDRDRDPDRDARGRGDEGRGPRRSALKDAAGAIGVSGAAATLLSVLAQAVTHL